MKFLENQKEKGSKQGCKSCNQESVMPGASGMPGMNREQIAQQVKQLKEQEKNRAKATDCPFIKECEFLVMPQIGQMICLDEEVGPKRRNQGYGIHMHGHHVWEQCRQYAERLRKTKGILPRNVKKALKQISKDK